MQTFKEFLIEDALKEKFLDMLPITRDLRDTIRDNVNKKKYKQAIEFFKKLIKDNNAPFRALHKAASSYDINDKEFYRVVHQAGLI